LDQCLAADTADLEGTHMKLNIFTLTAAALTAVTLAAPASAQDDRGRYRSPGSVANNRGGDNRSQPAERAQPRTEQAPRVQQAPRVEQAPRVQQAPRVEQAPRVQQAPRFEQAPRVQQAPRVEQAPRVQQAPRVEQAPRVDGRVEGRAVPRGDVRPNYNGDRRDNYRPDYRPDYRPNYRPSYGYGYGYGRPVYRPYVFRPRFNIGFGVFVGYPVTYSYAYPYPIPVYGYGAPVAPVIVGPSSPYYGGIALEISPDDAAVYVDGTYAGIVRDFDGTTRPLTLSGGTHRIQITAPGFEPLSFDVQVQPGQVIPYQGDMQPY
jgi:hypothetical protein